MSLSRLLPEAIQLLYVSGILRVFMHPTYKVYLPTFPNSDAGDFFPSPRPPEKGLGPSSKETGASMNEAESLPLRGCFACFNGVSRRKCIVSSRSRR